MRIAHFTDAFLPEVSGVATSIATHTTALASRGHEVLIMCPRYREQALFAVPGIMVRRYASFSFVSNKATRVALPSLASAVKTLRRFEPDVVHIHTPLGVGVAGVMAARWLGVPNVQTYHTYIPDFMQYVEPYRLLRLDSLQERIVNSLIFERMFESDVWQRLAHAGRLSEDAVRTIDETAAEVLAEVGQDGKPELSTRLAWQFTRTLYNRANLVLTPSEILKDELERNGITRPVEYLSNGIDMTLIEPKTDYAPTGRILHAGRLGHEKNIDVVVRAFAHLAERYPHATLDIIGEGPARAGLERLIAGLPVRDRIRLLGAMDRERLAKTYREYDLFATASTIETQGIVLLEAMTAGLPVVAVDALAAPELVRDGRDGFIVAPGDEKAMAERIAQMLDDEVMWRDMGANARQDMMPHELESVVSRLESLYSRVIAEGAETALGVEA